MDGSDKDNWQKQLNFIKTIINGNRRSDGLDISQTGTQVGMVTFGNNAKTHWNFNAYTVNIVTYILPVF